VTCLRGSGWEINILAFRERIGIGCSARSSIRSELAIRQIGFQSTSAWKSEITSQRLSKPLPVGHCPWSFVYSWGEVQKALGGILALLVGDEAAHKNFIKGLKAATKSKDATLQRYWYAHWMARHGLFRNRANKAEIEDELADLCLDIQEKRREPHTHNHKWFASLIQRNKADRESWVLKTTFTRLPRDQIQRMLNNKLIPEKSLPPLIAEEFPPVGGYVP
jgi:hypothetical protein